MTDASANPKTQEEENKNVDNTVDPTKIESVEEFRAEINKQLDILFNKDVFLGSKYFITHCLNANLDIQYSTLYKHTKIQKYIQGPQDAFKWENQSVNRNSILLDQVSKCSAIEFNKTDLVLSPNFKRERKVIIVNSFEVEQLEEFRKYIEGKQEIFKQEEKKEGEATVTIPNLKVGLSTDKKNIAIYCKDEKTTQEVFNFLFSTKDTFQGKPLTGINVVEESYYHNAYYQIFQQTPTNFKGKIPQQQFAPPLVLPQQYMNYNGMAMQPQQFQQQYQQRNYNNNNGGNFKQRQFNQQNNFQNNNNNNNRNNYPRNNNYNNNNNNGNQQYRNNRNNNYNQQQQQHPQQNNNTNNQQQQPRRYNNNNNNNNNNNGPRTYNNNNNNRQYNNNNRNYNNNNNNNNNHIRQKKNNVNVEDTTQFPGLGGAPQEQEVSAAQEQQ